MSVNHRFPDDQLQGPAVRSPVPGFPLIVVGAPAEGDELVDDMPAVGLDNDPAQVRQLFGGIHAIKIQGGPVGLGNSYLPGQPSDFLGMIPKVGFEVIDPGRDQSGDRCRRFGEVLDVERYGRMLE